MVVLFLLVVVLLAVWRRLGKADEKQTEIHDVVNSRFEAALAHIKELQDTVHDLRQVLDARRGNADGGLGQEKT